MERSEMNSDELAFAIFCIENVAERLRISGSEVYTLLTQENNILDDYIVSNYDMLHTQDKEYIVNDIIEYMQQEGLVK